MRPPTPPRAALRLPVEAAYIAAFVGVELAGLAHPLLAGVCHAALIVVLINHYVLAERDRRAPLLLALAVVCLYRLLALTPLPTNALTNHVVLVGAPMVVAAGLAIRHLREAGLTDPRPRFSLWLQLAIALSGVPLSYIAYKLLKPGLAIIASGPGKAHPVEVVVVVAALAFFSGFGEELLFRVLVHNSAHGTFGASALYASTGIFGAAYLGTRSVPFVLLAVAVGAFFGWCYEKTGSIVGTSLAHAMISVGVFVVWPTYAHLIHL